MKVVSAVDVDSMCPFAVPVQTKHTRDRYAVVSLARWLTCLNQPQITLQADGERPIRAFAEAVALEAKDRHGLVVNLSRTPQGSGRSAFSDTPRRRI